MMTKGITVYNKYMLQYYIGTIKTNNVLASRLHSACLPNTPQLTSYSHIITVLTLTSTALNN